MVVQLTKVSCFSRSRDIVGLDSGEGRTRRGASWGRVGLSVWSDAAIAAWTPERAGTALKQRQMRMRIRMRRMSISRRWGRWAVWEYARRVRCISVGSFGCDVVSAELEVLWRFGDVGQMGSRHQTHVQRWVQDWELKGQNTRWVAQWHGGVLGAFDGSWSKWTPTSFYLQGPDTHCLTASLPGSIGGNSRHNENQRDWSNDATPDPGARFSERL